MEMQENEGFDLAKYKEVLQAYKEINNLISSTMPSEKDIGEQKKLSQSLKGLSKVQVEEENDLSNDRNLHQENKSQRDDIQRNLKKIEEKENELSIKENELLFKDSKLKDQEQILVKLASQLKIKEKQLQDQELSLAKEIVNLENLKQSYISKKQELSMETLETISLNPDMKSFEKEDNKNKLQQEELRKKIQELEETNTLLNAKNTFLEEELLKFKTEINEQKFKIVKETELLINKENSLKVREQTLENRETKLIESTKFFNSAIKSVNQCMKAKMEQDENEETGKSLKSMLGCGLKADDLTFRGFVRNLNEIKDFSNIPNKGSLTTR